MQHLYLPGPDEKRTTCLDFFFNCWKWITVAKMQITECIEDIFFVFTFYVTGLIIAHIIALLSF